MVSVTVLVLRTVVRSISLTADAYNRVLLERNLCRSYGIKI